MFITEQHELDNVLTIINRFPIWAVDIETTGLDPYTHKPLLLGIGNDEAQIVIDLRQVNIAPLQAWFANKDVIKIFHNACFDVKFLMQHYNLTDIERVVDTMLAEQLLGAGRIDYHNISLVNLAAKHLDIKINKDLRKSFESMPDEQAFTADQTNYLTEDVLVTYNILLEQIKEIKKEGLVETFINECAAIQFFAKLELDGLYINTDKWKHCITTLEKRKQIISHDLHFMAGNGTKDLFGDYNSGYKLNSPKDISLILQKRGIFVESTKAEILEDLNDNFAKKLLEHRDVEKQLSTYGHPFLTLIHPKTKRIHPSFWQIGSDGGRPISASPNVQNIPREGEWRSCITAELGNTLVVGDYDGCELRIIAELSHDKTLVNIFKNDKDPHSVVGEMLFNQPIIKGKQNDNLRFIAKTLNYGLSYGMGYKQLAKRAKLSDTQAKTLFTKYFDMFKDMRQFLDDQGNKGVTTGWATSMGGRKRHFSKAVDNQQRGAIERSARNHPIQATNADIIKLACALLYRNLRDARLLDKVKFVNEVHDELVLECQKDISEAIKLILEETMLKAERNYLDVVPAKVDVKINEEWIK